MGSGGSPIFAVYAPYVFVRVHRISPLPSTDFIRHRIIYSVYSHENSDVAAGYCDLGSAPEFEKDIPLC